VLVPTAVEPVCGKSVLKEAIEKPSRESNLVGGIYKDVAKHMHAVTTYFAFIVGDKY
jgi:hypothetical protein